MEPSAAAVETVEAVATEAGGLIGLPAELLENIWERLSWDWDTKPRNRDQLALRSTCRAAKLATTPLITNLGILVDTDEAGAPLSEAEALDACASQLRRFPAGAPLSNLRLSFMPHSQKLEPFLAPGLLPSFILDGRSRLATLQTLVLGRALAITYGDMACLASVCTALKSLHLDSTPVVGPVFAPLSELRSLESLELYCVWVPEGSAAGAGPSLANLAHLTQLKMSPRHVTSRAFLAMEDVLPHLHGLDALRDVTLDLGYHAPEDKGVFRHLANLAHVTHLDVEVHPDTLLSGPELAGLSPATRLASLTLWGSVIDASGARLLAALPQLTELRCSALEPDEDLRHLPCSWEKLTLGYIRVPQHLARLPLRQLRVLRVAPDRQTEAIDWIELSAVAAAESTARAVGEAARVLQQAWICKWSALLKLRLDFAPVDEAPAIASPLLTDDTRRTVLAALAPLSGRQQLQLQLCQSFDPSAHTVDVLLECLPSLRFLAVDSTSPSFAAFAEVAATRLTALRALSVGLMEGDVVPDSAKAALLAMAVARASAALPLCIEVASGMTEEQLEGYNDAVEASRRGIDSGRVVFTHRLRHEQMCHVDPALEDVLGDVLLDDCVRRDL